MSSFNESKKLDNSSSSSDVSQSYNSKKNGNLDAYFNNSGSVRVNKKRRSQLYNNTPSSSYSSLDRNSRVMEFLKSQKTNGTNDSSSSSKKSKSSTNSSESNAKEQIKDVLDEEEHIVKYETGSDISESDAESEATVSTRGKKETLRFDSFTLNSNKNSNSIAINKKKNNHHEGYMSLPVANNELSRSTSRSFKDYSRSIDDWAVSYKKTVNTKMEAMTMTYSEIKPSLKAYRKKIKNRKNHPELYAEEEGVPLNYNYESLMNYDEDATTELKPESNAGLDQSTEVIDVSENGNENELLIPKPEDLEKKSTFTQSCFNSVNVLMGIGLISFPFAFYLTGWVVGVIMLIAFALLTMHTAKILGKCMRINNLTNYSEIGYAAYGKKGYVFISLFFSFELFACSVSLIILIADSLVALFPGLNGTMIKILSFFLITPLTYPKHLGALAWGSLIGIFAIANLATILFYDGFSKEDAPGSLITPAETYLLPVNLMRVPLTIGILMAGFSGHSVFPTIYHDMKEPKRYNSVVNISYFLTFLLYLLVAAAGYAMFGENTLPEITQNIAEVPVYSRFVNRLTIWLMVVNPITKYGVNLIPLNANVEQIYEPLLASCSSSLREIIRLSGRTFISFLVVFVAIVFPEFHQVLCLLGSLFSMIICVIFPCMCYSVLYKGKLSAKEIIINKTIIIVSTIIALIGTIWAFIPNIL